MKSTKVLSLSVVMALPIILSGCEGLFTDRSSSRPNNAPQSYYNYSDDNYGSDGASRSYGTGGNNGGSSVATSKPRSDRPSTSSTADSIESSAEVPIEPPTLE